jgi:hypothetical protein
MRCATGAACVRRSETGAPSQDHGRRRTRPGPGPRRRRFAAGLERDQNCDAADRRRRGARGRHFTTPALLLLGAHDRTAGLPWGPLRTQRARTQEVARGPASISDGRHGDCDCFQFPVRVRCRLGVGSDCVGVGDRDCLGVGHRDCLGGGVVIASSVPAAPTQPMHNRPRENAGRPVTGARKLTRLTRAPRTALSPAPMFPFLFEFQDLGERRGGALQ